MDDAPEPTPVFDIEELKAMLAGISDPDTRRRMAANYAHTHTGEPTP